MPDLVATGHHSGGPRDSGVFLMERQSVRGARLASIDYLRVYAALTVVFGHALHFVAELPQFHGAQLAAYRQGSGALVFIGVAGFITLYTERERFGIPGRPVAFLARRVRRLLPLYWVFTTLWLCVALLLPQLLDRNVVDVGHVFSSYLMLPWPRAGDGALRPVLSPGWTLNYIIWFYVFFAAALCLRRGVGIGLMALVLMLLGIEGSVSQPGGAMAFLLSPYWLVFVTAMAVIPLHGWCQRRSLALPPMVSLLLVGLLFFGSWQPDVASIGGQLVRMLLCWGIVVVAAVTAPFSGGSRSARLLSSLAGSSYSLYLSQAFSLGIFAVLVEVSGLDHVLTFVPLVLLAAGWAILVGLLVHRLVEQPLAVVVDSGLRILSRRPAS